MVGSLPFKCDSLCLKFHWRTAADINISLLNQCLEVLGLHLLYFLICKSSWHSILEYVVQGHQEGSYCFNML